MIKDFDDIIRLWPSKRHLARVLGMPDQNSVKWSERNSIPAEWWNDVMAAVKTLKPRPRDRDGKLIELTAQQLTDMYERRWRSGPKR